MMVTFISQCEKKALAKTRRVLDAFANRIGDNTWQTVITEDGLLTVKKMLRRTASKSTAVSCHWIRSRSRSQFLWVVGKREKFDNQGWVPVNTTESDISPYIDSGHWQSIEIIRYAAAIAGLFHDFGKANKLFQDKINPKVNSPVFEPYRHEWISLRLFQVFVGRKSDKEWLDELADVQPEEIEDCFRDGLDGSINNKNHPLRMGNLPPFARLVAWLVLTHHRLPMAPAWNKELGLNVSFRDIGEWLDNNFDAVWNSYRCQDADQKDRLEDNWSFLVKALPYNSSHWRAMACTLASTAKQKLSGWLGDTGKDFVNDHLFISHTARLCVMLADHHYSAQKEVTPDWRNPKYKVYANSDRETKKLKQQLDEHLIGVAHHAECIVNQLPKLKRSLSSLGDKASLSNTVAREFKGKFGWQDRAVKEIDKLAEETVSQGFFGINIASTGKGKTLANAKIMYALGQQTGGVRFSVALGLRTLTLQTGREFRKELKLTAEELAILVGGSSVTQLFENAQKAQELEDMLEASGSASDQDVLQDELYLHYLGAAAEHSLSEWTKVNARLNKLLCAPVLVCTIDHLMPATEGTRGGKQIGPMLRLLTSDLVLDEPDDFGLEDLPALCRLVHGAGMSGSRVLLSTATMPPAIAYALFQAYKAGWVLFAKENINGWGGDISCAWFDEYDSTSVSVSDFSTYRTRHEKFVKDRLKNLAEDNTPKRRGEIVEVGEAETGIINAIAATCYQQLCRLHQHHHVVRDDCCVSVGLIRMANINPLVAIAQALLRLSAPKSTQIHYCVYHSRFPLAIRSHIENRLDRVLMRKDEEAFWSCAEISEAVVRFPQVKNHIFVVLASPVAEVGRDHDYDWAIVEPSSMRSIIQLAGRVLRHREADQTNSHPNVLLLNKNHKALKGEKVCFHRPGFESSELRVQALDLRDILPANLYQTIDAAPRIKMPDLKDIENTKVDGLFGNLNHLEHMALTERLFSGKKRAKVWWESKPDGCGPHWAGEVQRQQRFRMSDENEAYYLIVNDEYIRPYWQCLNENVYPPKFGEVSGISVEHFGTLPTGDNVCFWFELDALSVYSRLAEDFDIDLLEVSKRFGELRVTNYPDNRRTEYQYHDALGLFQELDD